MESTLYTLLIPVIGTTLGSAMVFLIKDQIPQPAQRALLAFAAGVMIAASVWSLLIPGLNMTQHLGPLATLPVALGLALGMTFLLLIDNIVPHLHSNSKTPEGPPSHLSRTQMLALALTIHNLPEGMAVGIVAADALSNPSAAAPLAVSLGIALQNIPEGAIVSMPLRAAGSSRPQSFLIGSLSGLVEPIGALSVILLAETIQSLMPSLLGFAAGAMLYVVVEDLIPQATSGPHSNIPVIAFGFGFLLMMLMDTTLA